MRHRILCFVVFVAAVVAGFAVEAGEPGRLTFAKKVNFKLEKKVSLEAEVGPVRIDSVEFINRGAGTTKSKVFGVLRRSGSSDTTVTLRSAFAVENPVADEWELTATLEFFDAKGKLIDRVKSSRDFEGEAAVWTIDQPILGYVVPLIASVKIDVRAKVD